MTLERLIDIASRMAQELQDHCDDAERAGTPMLGAQELIDEWEALYASMHNHDEEQ